ncbi:MAG: hypothetical protein KDA31_07220 [Phycisphaerales bacterium]|nr:hypothetical protein [Phycisphaerales bacterium]
MNQKPRVVFDTSIWLACFRGEFPELEYIVETHDILTPDVCLLEITEACERAPARKIKALLRIVSVLHEIAETTTETAVAAAFQDRSRPLGTRLAVAHAAEQGIPVYFCSEGVLKKIEPEAAVVMTQL